MSDLLVRSLFALALLSVAWLVILTAKNRERRRAAVAPLDLTGVDGALVLFSDVACSRCDEARRVLREHALEFAEIAYDREPERFGEIGVEAVPILVARGRDGAEVGRIAGRVTARGLSRLLSRM